MTGLNPDRMFPLEGAARGIAPALYDGVCDLPIISPHGHTDLAWFAEDDVFPYPAQLFITPDQYISRMLASQGAALEDLGVARRDGGLRTSRFGEDPVEGM